MIINDEIRVTNVEGIARSNKESALALFVIRHSLLPHFNRPSSNSIRSK
jgi:hypothetical protein